MFSAARGEGLIRIGSDIRSTAKVSLDVEFEPVNLAPV